MDDTELLQAIYRSVEWSKLYEQAPEADRDDVDDLFSHLRMLIKQIPRKKPQSQMTSNETAAEEITDLDRALLNTDGASRGNPGPGGTGWVITTPSGDEVLAGGTHLGKVTNNQAEYRAVIEGLQKALELGVQEITLRSDSQLLVRQINGRYQVKSGNLKPLYSEVKKLLNRFDDWTAEHVRREKNSRADELAKESAKNKNGA